MGGSDRRKVDCTLNVRMREMLVVEERETRENEEMQSCALILIFLNTGNDIQLL